MATVTATLDRSNVNTPWGFRMHGGVDFSAPLTVQRVTPGSLAARCGLQVGDIIVKIASNPSTRMTHKEAQQRIVTAQNTLQLTLQRKGGADLCYSPPAPVPSSFPPPAAAPSMAPLQSPPQQPYQPASQPSYQPPQQQSYQPPPTQNTQMSNSSAPSSQTTWKPKVPTGPRKPKLGKVGEARSVSHQQGSRIPICGTCGIQIRGPFVSALEKTWCPDHFVCANPTCARPLVDIGFVEEEGQLFCEKDYGEYLAPRCGKCQQAIVGECVNALRNTFHPHCFTCAHCGQNIGTGSFHLEEGQAYCDKDWQQLFQTKCVGCQFPIEPGDRWVEALNGNWHSECFNCSTCQVNLEGQSFFAKNGKPYCKKHAGATKKFM